MSDQLRRAQPLLARLVFGRKATGQPKSSVLLLPSNALLSVLLLLSRRTVAIGLTILTRTRQTRRSARLWDILPWIRS